MPSVTKYLQDSGWFQLKGHHKVGLNTYPNLMAILSGQFAKSEQEEKRVWRDFEANKYITMYAEDVLKETFEYYENRTDFGSRAMKVLLELLPYINHINYAKCNWYFPVFERVYDQLMDFVTAFRGERYFGLFVSSASSHDDVSGPSMLEPALLRYVKDFDRQRITEDAIIFLYGDHGLRFGGQRPTFEGAREDSMPMVWISLPKWMQGKYPEIVSALQVNKHRLSSHLDFYHTLRHIIALNGGRPLPANKKLCTSCQSLFLELPKERRCGDAGIPFQFCFCNAHKTMHSRLLRREKVKALDFIVKSMNDQIEKYAPGECRRVQNASIIRAWKVEDNGFVVLFKANIPHRAFEGVVSKHNNTNITTVRNLHTQRGMRSYGPVQVREFCYMKTGAAEGSLDRVSFVLCLLLVLFLSEFYCQ